MTTDESYALAETIRRHAALFDTPNQAVIGTTLDGEIVYWSATAEKLYGWSALEVEGKQVVDVTPAEGLKTLAGEIMGRLRVGRSWSGSFRVRSRDAQEFEVLITDVPVKDAHGRLVGIVGISSRKDT